jgi:hypothetical protein
MRMSANGPGEWMGKVEAQLDALEGALAAARARGPMPPRDAAQAADVTPAGAGLAKPA